MQPQTHMRWHSSVLSQKFAYKFRPYGTRDGVTISFIFFISAPAGTKDLFNEVARQDSSERGFPCQRKYGTTAFNGLLADSFSDPTSPKSVLGSCPCLLILLSSQQLASAASAPRKRRLCGMKS